MNNQSRVLGGLLFGLLLASVVIGAWRYRSTGDAIPEVLLPLNIDVDCNSAQAACVARGEEFAVELSLGPPVQPMQPFNIQLHVLQGQLSTAAQVELQFQMQDMDMGQNRYRLMADEQGAWRGTAVLPVCSRGRSDWVAKLDVQDGDRHWSAELPFTAIAQ